MNQIGNLKVLVVDDQKANRVLFRQLFKLRGLDCVETDNGLDVLAKAKEHMPALILLDIQLPGQSGLDAAEQLRGDPATFAIPIIAVTAYTGEYDRANVLASGCDMYLAKPLKLQEFFDAIDALLGAQIEARIPLA